MSDLPISEQSAVFRGDWSLQPTKDGKKVFLTFAGKPGVITIDAGPEGFRATISGNPFTDGKVSEDTAFVAYEDLGE